jgi:hypothetical protein
VEPQIEPEPSEEERQAILAALAQEAEPGTSAYRSRWRETGVREAVEGEEE